jgi:hypothetical protein
MGALVNEYAWTRISFLAEAISLITASVAPPFGEKKTSMIPAVQYVSAPAVEQKAQTSAIPITRFLNINLLSDSGPAVDIRACLPWDDTSRPGEACSEGRFKPVEVPLEG